MCFLLPPQNPVGKSDSLAISTGLRKFEMDFVCSNVFCAKTEKSKNVMKMKIETTERKKSIKIASLEVRLFSKLKYT